MLCSPSTI